MEDIYLKNYWLLNIEFIETFSSLTYQNLPLPLLSNFYQYLDDSIKATMQSPDFNQYGTKTFNENEIQPQFEKWLEVIRQPIQTKPITGKLLLNFDYLRFTENNYYQFDPNRTLLLTRWNKKQIYNIPVICSENYRKSQPHITNDLIQQANAIFEKNRHHPVFSQESFQKKLLMEIPLMIEKTNMAFTIFRKVSISAVIVGTTEDLTSRILTVVASSKGIPSYCLQHGLILGEEAFLPAFATKQVVYGAFERDWYLKKGVPENQLSIIGHPRYDAIFTLPHMNKLHVFKKLQLNPLKKTVLMATQPFSTSFYLELTNLLIKNPNIQVIIKPHPWEKAKNLTGHYITLSKRFKQVKYVTTEIPLYNLISSSDIVVIANSTVGLEAMLLDKPVVVYKSLTANRNYTYFDSLQNLVCDNANDIHRMIHTILSSASAQQVARQQRRQFISRNYPQKVSTPLLINLLDE